MIRFALAAVFLAVLAQGALAQVSGGGGGSAGGGGGTGGITQLQGDGSAGPGTGLQTFTLNPTGVAAGSYTVSNGSSQYCWTVDGKGRTTDIVPGACGGGAGSVLTGNGVILTGGSSQLTE